MGNTFSISNHIPTSRRCVCLFCFLLFISFAAPAQIYNYDPIRNNNIETNPAALVSNYSKLQMNFTQYNALLSLNQFSNTSLKIGLKSRNNFLGSGVFMAHTRVNDSVNYQYAGFGLAYRTIVFNSLQLKLGAVYKANTTNVSGGAFDYQLYTPDSASRKRTEFIQNANFSLSLSSSSEKFYVSAGLLNYLLAFQPAAPNTQFPQYWYVNIGDLGKMFMDRNTELNYTLLFTKEATGKMRAPSHYLNFSKQALAVTRESTLLWGFRIGTTENRGLQLNPLLDFYQRFDKSRGMRFGFMYDIGFDIKTLKKLYPPGTQFHLTLFL